jgi:hypothetical protein
MSFLFTERCPDQTAPVAGDGAVGVIEGSFVKQPAARIPGSILGDRAINETEMTGRIVIGKIFESAGVEYPPPSWLALLPETTLFVMLRLLKVVLNAPPPRRAEFCDIVVRRTSASEIKIKHAPTGKSSLIAGNRAILDVEG